ISASAEPVLALSPSATALVTPTRALLSATDPVSALAQLEASYRTFVGTGDTARVRELELVRHEAFRDAAPAQLDAFYRRLGAQSAASTRFAQPLTRTGARASLHEPQVLYVNGILSDPADAISTLVKIGALAKVYGFNTRGIYNPSWHHESGAGWLNCMLKNAQATTFTRAFAAIVSCNSLVRDLAEGQAQIELVTAGATGTHPFVGQLKNDIEKEVDAGRSVVVAAHSQGSVMTQEALTQLLLATPASFAPSIVKCVGVVSFGAPLSEGFPSKFRVDGMIAAGAVSKDVLLWYPAKNRFPTRSSSITASADVLNVLLNQFFPFNIAITGFWIHLSGSYLWASSTSGWIQQHIGEVGTQLAANCTDVVTASPANVSVPVGGSAVLGASRFTPTGKPVSAASFTWTSSNTSIARVVTSPSVQVIGVSPGTARIDAVSGEASASVQVLVTPAPTPSVTLTAQPPTIAVGGTSTLSWTSANVSSCTAPWTTATAAMGSQVVAPTVTTNYSITCVGTGGSAGATALITVTLPPGAGGVASIAAGYDHTCAVGTDAITFCWGSNLLGAIGQSWPDVSGSPVPLPVSGTASFALVGTGVFRSCAVDQAGAAFCWGSDANLPAGRPYPYSSTPVAVPQSPRFTKLAQGSSFACGIAVANDVHCWGYLDGLLLPRTPGRVPSPLQFKQLTAGLATVCALDSGGAAHCWGNNLYGAIGDGRTGNKSAVPLPVLTGEIFMSLATGGSHSCGVSTAGAAFCWGTQTKGQLGTGDGALRRLTPTKVAGSLAFSSITAGLEHTCALTASGQAFCWGSNAYGQLGGGTSGDRMTPAAVAGGLMFGSLSAGALHTCGITTGGRAYCWGGNNQGQLGDGSSSNQIVPTPVRWP
ncbi:MAG: Ig-like domain-containing protein, partial [Gemmatimonadaceae bacterium]|nr:Ig-like domain-containing protein [Gemmatimonadaceae bacterium]